MERRRMWVHRRKSGGLQQWKMGSGNKGRCGWERMIERRSEKEKNGQFNECGDGSQQENIMVTVRGFDNGQKGTEKNVDPP